MAQPAAVAVDIECAAGQATGPEVLIDDEVPSISSADGNVPFMDGGSKQVAIATPDRFKALDRLVGETDDLVDDSFAHRGKDRLDVTVVFGAQLTVDKVIELGAGAGIDLRRWQHATNYRPRR